MAIVFLCLNATIPLTCTLANEYPSSNEISKKNGAVRGDCIACDALLRLSLNLRMIVNLGSELTISGWLHVRTVKHPHILIRIFLISLKIRPLKILTSESRSSDLFTLIHRFI